MKNKWSHRAVPQAVRIENMNLMMMNQVNQGAPGRKEDIRSTVPAENIHQTKGRTPDFIIAPLTTKSIQATDTALTGVTNLPTRTPETRDQATTTEIGLADSMPLFSYRARVNIKIYYISNMSKAQIIASAEAEIVNTSTYEFNTLCADLKVSQELSRKEASRRVNPS